jgi:hypothetical protein
MKKPRIITNDRKKGKKKIKFVIGTKMPFAKLIPFPAVVTLNSSLGFEPAYRIDKAQTVFSVSLIINFVMTKIIKNFTGIDVSKGSFNVSIEKDGKIQSKQFLYTPAGLQSCLGFIPSESRCIIESTGTYHCRLCCYLTANNVKVSIVNPLSVKRFAQALMLRTKTDKADSKMLIEYGKHFDLPVWQPQESCYVQMHQLINLS